MEFNEISSNPWSTNDDSIPSALVPEKVLILALISVVCGNNVCIFGLIILNGIFCVALGPFSNPTTGLVDS